MKKSIVLLTILSILLMGCNGEPAIQYTYRPPEDAGDGLAVGTLEEVGIDSVLIENAVSRILSGKYTEVHSLLIVKDDQLVLWKNTSRDMTSNGTHPAIAAGW